MDFDTLISDVQKIISDRLEYFFGKRDIAPSPDDFRINGKKGEALTDFVKTYDLSGQEQLLLSMALIPHLVPGLFSGIIKQFLPQGGDLPIFGAAKGRHHRGIIPTGETAQFIMGGTSMKHRLAVSHLLTQSKLIKNGVLYLEAVPEGEPVMSGKLLVSREYADLFFKGKMSTPDFGPDFPAQKISTEREWEDLVLSEDVKSQLGELQLWMQYNDRLMQDWDMKKKLNPGYRVLFHGPSGTGKTMTATLLGKYTDRHVFRVDLSTVISKYIGETEKNMEKLFRKAAHKNWILFFDEADALFGKRTEVNDSHDRYANQEVSYLLQRVENFGGLVILATNYKTNIDEAFLRRFNAIIKFPFPNASLRARIWKKSLPQKARFGKNLNLDELASAYKLTGGNIMNIVQLVSLDALSRKSKTITRKSLLHGIRREVEKEGKVFTDLLQQKIPTNGSH